MCIRDRFAANEGGPVVDMGPYYITALVTLLGSVKSVTSKSKKVFLEREIGIGPRKGKKFKVECDTTYVSTLEFKNNSLIQMTLSFDVKDHKRNHIELYLIHAKLVLHCIYAYSYFQ